MLQELFRFSIFGHEFPVYGYGLMLVVAYLACVKAGQLLGRRVGINPDHFVNATVIGLATGVFGARLCHVLENFADYSRSDLSLWQNLFNALNIRAGGLTFYGGFLFATPCLIFYALKNKIPLLLGMDVVAPLLMIGLGFGRIGCFLNGCCYGERSDLPWAVRFPYYSDAYIDQYSNLQITAPAQLLAPTSDGRYVLIAPHSPEMDQNPQLQKLAASTRALPVHPTELYSMFTAFLLAGLLIAFLTTQHIDGQVFALMMFLEGIARFVLELIRVEPAVYSFHFAGQSWPMSISMILGLLVSIAGLVMFFALRHPRQQAIPA